LGFVFLGEAFFGGFVFAVDLPGPLVALDGGEDGAVVVAAEAREFAVDLAEALPSGLGIEGLIEERGGQAGEFDGDEGGEAVADLAAVGGSFEFGGLLGELGDEGKGFLLAEPIEVAGLLPIGEVLFGNGASVELGFEDFLDLGEAAEPFDEVFAGFAVFEAVAQLVADFPGQSGDFTDAGGDHKASWVWGRIKTVREQKETKRRPQGRGRGARSWRPGHCLASPRPGGSSGVCSHRYSRQPKFSTVGRRGLTPGLLH